MMSEREAASDAQQLPKSYEPATVEAAIYQRWLESGAFAAVPDGRPPERRYVIMMPLPNVTGALHMGHAMDNVMQDLLTRWHRMQGDNTLWMPGTDHAGIATQAVVEKRLKELEGKTRHDLGRDGLVRRIWSWKDQYQARIVGQQQRMGCSCDWSRQRFTMDAVCARAVRHAFQRLFGDGLIYRGKRLVNWDVSLQTSVSDDEVYHETVSGQFWHLRYPVIDPQPGEPTAVVVATTRPETMLGDTAVAVHPAPDVALEAACAQARAALAQAPAREQAAAQQRLDELERRRRELLPTLLCLRDMARAGRHVRLPLLDRPLPLVCDAWAKPELGSGCVKITPAHDPNDYEVWLRHRERLAIINILEADGTLNAAAGPYAGLDRLVARERVVADLQAQGLLERVEAREVELGHSDRSKTPIEPLLSDQWFVRMGDVAGGIVLGRGTPRERPAAGLVQAAIDAVTSGRVRLHPERYTKTYLDWLAEKRDWPISRQLWWGHRIPVWSRQGSWAELGASALAGLWAALGPLPAAVAGSPRVVVRLHRLDGSVGGATPAGSVLAPGVALPLDLAADERCSIDVCLLDDDPALVAALEGAGYLREVDVLDTWFSSALWPFSTLGWPDPSTAALEAGQRPLGPEGAAQDALAYYYPGSCLVTGRDIITLWVARMVLSGLYALGEAPFADVFIHANILDGKGERMSKTKGNGIDPVDISAAYGTDAMRYVLCEMQTGTQDIRLPVTAICPRCAHHNDLAQTATGKSIFIRICGACGGEFDVLGTIAELPAGKLVSERFDVGRAFCTKLWNSARFALGHLERGAGPSPLVDEAALALEDRWILDQLDQTISTVQLALEDYNPSAAVTAARELFWGAFCDWYLELIKPRLAAAESPTAQTARAVLAYVLDQVLRLFHPFVPFITEHLWQRLDAQVPERGLGLLAPLVSSPLLISAPWPAARAALQQPALRRVFADLQALTRAVRDVRVAAGVPPRHPVAVTIKLPADRQQALLEHGHVVQHLAAVEALRVDAQAKRQRGSAVKVVGDLEVHVHDVIDDDAERLRLQQQLEKAERELAQCQRKLSNASFIERAPAEVVQEQRDRALHYQTGVAALQCSLKELEEASA
ncbi:MAG: valine--tRNA ligase [Proteobacteria bacterium]|nr:valine--tRNA ligase [Pseudomonadota bacterium]